MLAEITFTQIWPVVATIVCLVSGACTGSFWFSMQSLKDSIRSNAEFIKSVADKQAITDKDISGIKDCLFTCRRECDETHANKNDFSREAGYQRLFQEKQIAAMAKIEAKLDIMQKLPEISAAIAHAIAAEMKRGE